MRYLVDELNYYDPDPLHDIATGRFLEALSRLPALTRMLMEANDWYIEVDERGRIVKVIRQRDPEFQQGEDSSTTLKLEAEADKRYGLKELGPNEEDALVAGEAVPLGGLTFQERQKLIRQRGTSSDEGEEETVEEEEAGEGIEQEWGRPKTRWDLLYYVSPPAWDGSREFYSADLYPSGAWKGKVFGGTWIKGRWYSFQWLMSRVERLLLFGEEPLTGERLSKILAYLRPEKCKARALELWLIAEFLRDKKEKERKENARDKSETDCQSGGNPESIGQG